MIDWAIASCGSAIGVPMSILNILTKPLEVPMKPKKASITAICIKVFVNRWERAKIPQISINRPNSEGMSAKMLIIPVAKYPTSPRIIKRVLNVKV